MCFLSPGRWTTRRRSSPGKMTPFRKQASKKKSENNRTTHPRHASRSDLRALKTGPRRDAPTRTVRWHVNELGTVYRFSKSNGAHSRAKMPADMIDRFVYGSQCWMPYASRLLAAGFLLNVKRIPMPDKDDWKATGRYGK